MTGHCQSDSHRAEVPVAARQSLQAQRQILPSSGYIRCNENLSLALRRGGRVRHPPPLGHLRDHRPAHHGARRQPPRHRQDRAVRGRARPHRRDRSPGVTINVADNMWSIGTTALDAHSAAGGATAPGRSDVNSPRNRRTWSGEQQFDANGGIAGGYLAVERYQRGVASLGKGCQVVIGPQLVALVVARGDRTPDRIQFGWLIGP